MRRAEFSASPVAAVRAGAAGSAVRVESVVEPGAAAGAGRLADPGCTYLCGMPARAGAATAAELAGAARRAGWRGTPCALSPQLRPWIKLGLPRPPAKRINVNSPVNQRLAVYPGTFDPIANGHADLVARAAPLFERIVVAVAESPNKGKGPGFTMQERISLARLALADLKNVEVRGFDCLLAQFVSEIGAGVIIRGLRAVSDFEYEFQLASMNRHL